MGSKEKNSNIIKRFRVYLAGLFYQSEKGSDYSFLKVGNLRAHETTDPALIRKAFMKHDDFDGPGFVTVTLRKIIGRALPADEGESWKHMRKVMNAAFTKKQIRDNVTPIIIEECNNMLDRWQISKQPIDAEAELQKATGKIISRYVFGDGLNEKEADTIIELAGRALKELEASEHHDTKHSSTAVPYDLGGFKISVIMKVLGLSHAYPAKIPNSLKARLKQAEDILFPVIDERRKLDKQPDDVMGILINADNLEGKPLTNKEIKDQLITLLVAGHETTSVSLTFALDEILKCTHVQEKIREEFNALAVDGELTGFDIPQMRFTNNAFEEGMRMHPAISSTARETTRDLTECGVEFRKHDLLKLDIKGAQMRQDLWGDPEEYRPERHEEQGCPVKALMPFGHGARVCIGAPMAKFEGAIFLSKIFNRFYVQPVQHLEGEDRFFAVRPKGKLLFSVAPR